MFHGALVPFAERRKIIMKNKFDLKTLIIPAAMGIMTFITAVVDSKRSKKIDELSEKIDKLESKDEEVA